jgi:acylpyruvate hydrolase
MKIICIGRNYAAHVKELNNSLPTNPVIFLKPSTALLKDNTPFFYPSFSKDIHYEAELVLKIGKSGKHIAPKYALNYISHIGLGIDFTARDLQEIQKSKGLPWEIAKAFDHSAVIGSFIEVTKIPNLNNIDFRLDINEENVQTGNSSMMLFSFEAIISYVSQYFTLQMGDLIFTGTPEGVGPIKIGDKLKGYLIQEEIFSFEIK